jgi:nicotinamide riboside kinase
MQVLVQQLLACMKAASCVGVQRKSFWVHGHSGDSVEAQRGQKMIKGQYDCLVLHVGDIIGNFFSDTVTIVKSKWSELVIDRSWILTVEKDALFLTPM